MAEQLDLEGAGEPVAVRRQRRKHRVVTSAPAAEVVGEIRRGDRLFGVNRNRFDLVEMILHLIETAGPCDVFVLIGFVGRTDFAPLREAVEDGRVRSLRYLIDSTFPVVARPKHLAALHENVPAEAQRYVANHAKLVLVRNDTWGLVLRTSANMNQNTRLEQFDIEDDGELCGVLWETLAEAFAGAADFDEAKHRNADAVNRTPRLCGPIRRNVTAFGFDIEAQGMSYG